ncbi:MAG TPA: hypothetical protein VGI99_09225, partial [Gemmataceae bacterium]
MYRVFPSLLSLTVCVLVLRPLDLAAQHRAESAAANARARQDLVKTVNAEFKTKETIYAGAVSKDASDAPKSRSIRSKQTTTESTSRLALSGPKVRYENNHP